MLNHKLDSVRDVFTSKALEILPLSCLPSPEPVSSCCWCQSAGRERRVLSHRRVGNLSHTTIPSWLSCKNPSENLPLIPPSNTIVSNRQRWQGLSGLTVILYVVCSCAPRSACLQTWNSHTHSYLPDLGVLSWTPWWSVAHLLWSWKFSLPLFSPIWFLWC